MCQSRPIAQKHFKSFVCCMITISSSFVMFHRKCLRSPLFVLLHSFPPPNPPRSMPCPAFRLTRYPHSCISYGRSVGLQLAHRFLRARYFFIHSFHFTDQAPGFLLLCPKLL